MMKLPETIQTPVGPSVVGASAHLLAELLIAFEESLREQGLPVDDYLRPGASPDDVRAIFDRFNLVAPDEVVTWFGWHDGRRPIRESYLTLPMFQAWSLEDVDLNRRARARVQPFGLTKEDWDPSWVQIMGDHNGLAVRCSGGPPDVPLVRALEKASPNTLADYTATQVVSLCAPVTWWIEGLRSGRYVWHPDANAWDAPTREFVKPEDRGPRLYFI
ncbi:MAG: hypothetical protein ABIP33_10440 [Pseudolysinimonas sp.]